MNMDMIFVILTILIFVAEAKLITFTGVIITENAGEGHLVFNCSASKYPKNQYAEFLINSKSTASSMFDNKSQECMFLHNEKDCDDLCKCYSDGRTYTWTFPLPKLKTSTICYSCHIFVNSERPGQNHICFNKSDFDNSKASYESMTTRGNVIISVLSETSHEEVITTNKPTFELQQTNGKSDPTYITTGIFQDTTTFTQTTYSTEIENHISTQKHLTKLSTENQLLYITKSKGDTDSKPTSQNWLYYGPLIGIGFFCLCLFECNIAVTYKCRKSTVIIQHTNQEIAHQTQSTRSHQTSTIEEFESESSEYESINEREFVGENEQQNLDIQISEHSYFDLIAAQDDVLPYEIPSLGRNEDVHRYIELHKIVVCNGSNKDEVISSNSDSECPSSVNVTENHSEYMDIHSRNSKDSEFCSGVEIRVISVDEANESYDSSST